MRWRVRHFLELRQRAFRHYLVGLPFHNELLQHRSAIGAASQCQCHNCFRVAVEVCLRAQPRPALGVRRTAVSSMLYTRLHGTSISRIVRASFSFNCSRNATYHFHPSFLRRATQFMKSMHTPRALCKASFSRFHAHGPGSWPSYRLADSVTAGHFVGCHLDIPFNERSQEVFSPTLHSLTTVLVDKQLLAPSLPAWLQKYTRVLHEAITPILREVRCTMLKALPSVFDASNA